MESEIIIKKYCGNVPERIKACRSREVAELLRDRMCSELSIGCYSTMINNALRDYVNKLINETFDKNGKNIYLEKRND